MLTTPVVVIQEVRVRSTKVSIAASLVRMLQNHIEKIGPLLGRPCRWTVDVELRRDLRHKVGRGRWVTPVRAELAIVRLPVCHQIVDAGHVLRKARHFGGPVERAIG